MGTNFYMIKNPCGACGRAEDEIHIGKSSGGWAFSLNTHPEIGIETLEDWRVAWKNNPIKNEYGDVITPAEMDRVVTERKAFRGQALRRAKVDGIHCLGHSEETYSIMRGDFC